jgi:transcriptional regulator with XRE-family HTH domain
VFGQLLRRCRRASGLSQEELGERAGVSVRTITDMERGQRTRPYRQTVGALAAALGLEGTQLDEFVRLSRRSHAEASDDGQTKPRESGGWPTPGTGARQPGAVAVPRQLPAPVRHFTGRIAELDLLTGKLSMASGTEAVVILAIGGPAGVGKTALAVRWAHQAASRFPDGHLYVNLRGYDLGLPSMHASEAIRLFLDAFQTPAGQIPASPEAQAGLYRSILVGKRVLIVADAALLPSECRGTRATGNRRAGNHWQKEGRWPLIRKPATRT